MFRYLMYVNILVICLEFYFRLRKKTYHFKHLNQISSNYKQITLKRTQLHQVISFKQNDRQM